MPTLTKLYSMQEASEHNSAGDCWIVVDGKVYDVSSYLEDHPGGDDVLLQVTGKDATDEFEDAGHSKTARELMETFCVGELDTSDIPQLEVVSKKQNGYIPEKLAQLSKQYWVAPVTVVGISVVATFLYLRNK